MKFAMVVPFVLLAVAPLIGRWRANVWLKKNMRRRVEQITATQLVETTQIP
jgi:drug/metabolite transporter superfamily protein YnfA